MYCIVQSTHSVVIHGKSSIPFQGFGFPLPSFLSPGGLLPSSFPPSSLPPFLLVASLLPSSPPPLLPLPWRPPSLPPSSLPVVSLPPSSPLEGVEHVTTGTAITSPQTLLLYQRCNSNSRLSFYPSQRNSPTLYSRLPLGFPSSPPPTFPSLSQEREKPTPLVHAHI